MMGAIQNISNAAAPLARDRSKVPLTVVIVISDLEYGGFQRQIVDFSNNVAESECRLFICPLNDCLPMARWLKNPERVHLMPRRFRFDFTLVPRLARFFREVKADVVYNILFDATIAGRLGGRLAGRPAVVDAEGNTNYRLKTKESVALRLTRWCNDMTIANSRAGAGFQSRLLGQAPESYRVVYNGVDADRFQPRPAAELRAQLGLTDEPVVGMFASFKPQKNHIYWLGAARRLIERVPRLKLMFVGDELFKGGSDSLAFKRTINQAVDDFGLRKNCLFAGNQTNVQAYYNLCTATVLPSLYEGTPNVALESMASGVPVVATDVSDNASLILDGRTGYIVPLDNEAMLADRVLRIVLESNLQKQLGAQARQLMIDEYSCQRYVEKTLAVFREAAVLKNQAS